MAFFSFSGVTRDSSKSEIAKNYRNLAKQYHPDRHKDEFKEEATEKFKQVATGDLSLDHPRIFSRGFQFIPSIDFNVTPNLIS